MTISPKRASVFLLLTLLVLGCGRRQSPVVNTTAAVTPAYGAPPDLAAIAKDPGRFEDSLVTVRGELVNAGRDYFKDLRLVLRDSLGNSIKVLPWLPVEIPPPGPNSNVPRPKIIRDYLNKRLVLTGHLRSTVKADAARVYHLEVREAAEEIE